MKIRVYSRSFNQTFDEVLSISWAGLVTGNPQDEPQSIVVLQEGCKLHIGDVSSDCVFEEYIYNNDMNRSPIYKNDVLKLNNDDIVRVKCNNFGITLVSLINNIGFQEVMGMTFQKQKYYFLITIG